MDNLWDRRSPSSNESTIGLLPGVDRREALLALQIEFERKARELGAELIVWKDIPAGASPDLEARLTAEMITLQEVGRLNRHAAISTAASIGLAGLSALASALVHWWIAIAI
jgi:hypothetical protein